MRVRLAKKSRKVWFKHLKKWEIQKMQRCKCNPGSAIYCTKSWIHPQSTCCSAGSQTGQNKELVGNAKRINTKCKNALQETLHVAPKVESIPNLHVALHQPGRSALSKKGGRWEMQMRGQKANVSRCRIDVLNFRLLESAFDLFFANVWFYYQLAEHLCQQYQLCHFTEIKDFFKYRK